MYCIKKGEKLLSPITMYTALKVRIAHVSISFNFFSFFAFFGNFASALVFAFDLPCSANGINHW